MRMPPTKKASPQDTESPTVRPEMQPPPTHPYCKITYEKKRDGWDRAKMAAEFVGIVFLIIYTLYTTGIYRANHQAAVAAQNTLCEIQKQTLLMRQETIGSQGAILVFDPTVAFDPFLGYGDVSFAVRAVPGRVAARNVAVDLTVQRITLPSKKPIGSPLQCSISAPQIVATDSLRLGQAQVCRLLAFNQEAIDEIMFTRQSIKISGLFSYENGFGEMFKQNICRIYLAYKYTGFISPGRGTSGGDSSFHDCAEFDQLFRRAMGYKQRYKEGYVAGSFPE